ncbi:uncharacterized protein LOC126456930 [Schistocerca serialis cubense]|uniref:uncharacterized protein LOC126456930 n=1 Tax=Schistocerca serialis cubense TaxID=2023355 RepID=UPI00214ED17E|nr:uncharacterized protein LOC126456930 [Schistocerca serialis cubense]
MLCTPASALRCGGGNLDGVVTPAWISSRRVQNSRFSSSKDTNNKKYRGCSRSIPHYSMCPTAEHDKSSAFRLNSYDSANSKTGRGGIWSVTRYIVRAETLPEE